MNSILTMLLGAAVNYIQTPGGQQKLVSLLPTAMGLFQSLVGKVDQFRDSGMDAEAQKVALAAHITELVKAAERQAAADHAADPTDTAFDQGVFRD